MAETSRASISRYLHRFASSSGQCTFFFCLFLRTVAAEAELPATAAPLPPGAFEAESSVAAAFGFEILDSAAMKAGIGGAAGAANFLKFGSGAFGPAGTAAGGFLTAALAGGGSGVADVLAFLAGAVSSTST